MHEDPIIWPFFPVYAGNPSANGLNLNPALLLDCGPTPVWNKVVREQILTLRTFDRPNGAPAPAVELRAQKHFGPVRTADNRRSSTCVAVVDALEWYMRKEGRLGADERFTTGVFQDLTKRSPVPNELTSLFHALLRARVYGAVKSGEPAPSPAEFFERAHFFCIADYVLLDHLESSSTTPHFDAWRTWMTHVGPVLVRMIPDEAFASIGPTRFDTYGAPRFSTRQSAAGAPRAVQRQGGRGHSHDHNHGQDHDHHGGQASLGQHAVVLTGYTKDKRFIVRNSWGEKWGKGGYAEVSEAYAAKAFTEGWGIHVGKIQHQHG